MHPMAHRFIKNLRREIVFVCLTLGTVPAGALGRGIAQTADAVVTVTDDGRSYILANGYLTATINKTTGDMTSLKVKGQETMGFVSGHHAGYWEQNPGRAARLESKMTIDPATNGGARGEVSIKGWSDGKDLNSGAARRPSAAAVPTGAAGEKPNAGEDTPAEEGETPAAAPAPQTALPAGVQANRGTQTNRRPGGGGPGLLVDMEIRYTLGKGEHGIFTYAIFSHAASYGQTQIGESRYGMKLNSGLFDWLSVDEQRDMAMPTGADWDKGTDLNMKEARRLTTGVKKGIAEHKYDYCVDLFDAPAFGWSSTQKHVGLYFINPSMEYLSSGPKHVELTGHLDDGDGGDPTLLDYWRGTHYGGSQLPIAAGEVWTKVVGPVMIYVNSGATPDAMFADAKQQAVTEAAKWPYAWVAGVDYPLAAGRTTVTGQMMVHDYQQPDLKLANLEVGLAYPDAAPGETGGRGAVPMTWQDDAKHYEFWTRGTPDGRFSIANVRPGTYQLHAIADGVLGEYAGKATVTVAAGGKTDLGPIDWKVVHYGRTLWQVGVPNRNASEFLMGNDHWHWGEYIEYARLFPKDVNFTIGKSDDRKDWFIYQVPHGDPNDTTGRSQGRETTWKVNFDMDQAPAAGERGILRMGISGVGNHVTIAVKVNGKAAGEVTGLVYNATINRDGIQGSWVEKDVAFDAGLMKAGTNSLTLTIPAGGLTNGIVYDVVRLELAPAASKGRRTLVR
jgi:rhamnogalacturonan endolyase